MSNEITDSGLPDDMTVPRRDYTMSRAALEQRRQASLKARENATGPTTDEGKSRSRLNAFKTGEFAASVATSLARPCKRTCPAYSECPHIDGETIRPGDRCPVHLDAVVDTIQAVAEAVNNGDNKKLNDLVAIRLGGNFKILGDIQEAILEDGVMVLENIGTDKSMVTRYKEHPLFDKLVKMSTMLNITPADFNLTPKSKDDDRGKESVAQTLADALKLSMEKGK